MNIVEQVVYLYFFVLTLILLGYASYSDIRTRSVNPFLFVPLIVAGAILDIISGISPLFVTVVLALFVLTYAHNNLPVYVATGAAIFAAGFIFLLQSPLLLSALIFMFFAYILGIGEKFFGIGDIKAFLSISLSFLNPIMILQVFHPLPYGIQFPMIFLLILNASLVSVFFVPYLLLLNIRKKSKISVMSLFSIEFDQKTLESHPERYSAREYRGRKYLLFKTPFLLPISVGFVIAIISGI